MNDASTARFDWIRAHRAELQSAWMESGKAECESPACSNIDFYEFALAEYARASTGDFNETD